MDLLNLEVNQSEFAQLVGVTRQSIQKHAAKIGLDSGMTLGQWLAIYCEHLRQEAAGRGGDAAKNLSQQRIEESRQNTLAKALDNMEKMSLLCPTENLVDALNELSHLIPTAIENAGEKIIENVTAQCDVIIDDELVFEPLRSATSSIANDASKCGQRFRGLLEESAAKAAGINF